jgi:hypothetical protein
VASARHDTAGERPAYAVLRAVRGLLTADDPAAVVRGVRRLTGTPGVCLAAESGILARIGPAPHQAALTTALLEVRRPRLLGPAELGCEHVTSCPGSGCAAAPVPAGAGAAFATGAGSAARVPAGPFVVAALSSSVDAGLLHVVSEAAAILACARPWSLPESQHRGNPDGILPVDVPGRTKFVAREQVHWVEADGDYVRLHVDGGEVFLVRIPISQLERRWSVHGFIRVHRGFLVPMWHITGFGPGFVEVDGERLPVSRRRAREVRARILRGTRIR